MNLLPRRAARWLATRLLAAPAVALACVAALTLATPAAHAADAAPQGVVDLQGSASVQVAPDLAVLTLSAERSGADSAALTAQVSRLLDGALQKARAVKGVQAASGGFSTQPRWVNRNGQSTRDGWTVAGTLILKSSDFATLGQLAGTLAQDGLMITGSHFEVSPAQRRKEESALIDAAIADFKAKAAVAARALGYAGYTLRSVRIDPLQGDTPPPRPMVMRAAMADAAAAPALPLEGGAATLQLTVQGSVQLTR